VQAEVIAVLAGSPYHLHRFIATIPVLATTRLFFWWWSRCPVGYCYSLYIVIEVASRRTKAVFGFEEDAGGVLVFEPFRVVERCRLYISFR